METYRPLVRAPTGPYDPSCRAASHHAARNTPLARQPRPVSPNTMDLQTCHPGNLPAPRIRRRGLSQPLGLVAAVLFAFAALVTPASAQSTGMIEGRVQHAITGDYLANARVAIKGTNVVTITNDGGFYRLDGVPAGQATLRVLYSGFDEQEVAVNVPAGQAVTQDFKLARGGTADDGTVRLDAYTVQSTRETDAAAIAVNEQRNSIGQKSVISADQFGTLPDNNPGELMKWLPGVSVEYFANNIVGISVRGLDATNTEINFDGMPVSSASIATGSSVRNDRSFDVLGSSAADIARVEFRMLRTPEDPANALGGSLNLVRRSAFEYSKPRLTYSALFTTDAEDFGFDERPGIRDTRMIGWRPNLKLTWTHPVSKKFGYAVTLAHNDVLARVHWSAPSWNYGNNVTADAAAARIAAGQPLTTVSVFNPQLTRDLIHDNPKQDITTSGSLKFDWRPMPELRMSYSLAPSRYLERAGDEIRFTWNTGSQPNTVTPAVLNQAMGSPGTNGIQPDGTYASFGPLGAGSIRYEIFEGWRNGYKNMLTNAAEAEWTKGSWKINGKASYSTSKHEFKDIDDGFFQATSLNGSSLPHVGIGSGTGNPQAITVNIMQRDYKMNHLVQAYTHATGATARGPAVDWQDLRNSYIGGAVSRQGRSKEIIAATRWWAKYQFSTRNPLSVRLGYDFTEQFRNIQSWDARLWTFVGADGLPSTQDDNAAQIAAVNVPPAPDSYFNSPAVPRISYTRLYDIYKTNPGWFRPRQAESHRFSVRDPYELSERTNAGWFELTGALFDNRFSYSGGVRYERTDIEGRAMQDRGSRVVSGIAVANAADPIERAVVQYVRKGTHGTDSRDGYFPSLQLNYNLTPDLVARLGYAKTQAKNRFARQVIASPSYSDTPVTSGVFAGAAGTVTLPSPELEPWIANNYEAQLQYYTKQGGVITAGAFRKNIDKVQFQRPFALLDTPAEFDQYDLDPAYQNYQVTKWINDGGGRIDGAEFSIRQTLDSWLPEWARGLTFTGSFNYNDLKRFNYGGGNISSDFSNFYETQIKGSLRFVRGKFTGVVGVIENGKVYRQREDAAGFEGHRYYPPYTTVDFSLEYSVTRWARLFLSGRNVTDAQKLRRRDVNNAPGWSTFHISNNLGVTYTAGVTGSF